MSQSIIRRLTGAAARSETIKCLQVAVLKSASTENEAMKSQLASLQQELAAAQAAAAAAGDAQHRAAAAEKAGADARQEAHNALAAAAAMEERVQAAEEEMDRVSGTLMRCFRFCAYLSQNHANVANLYFVGLKRLRCMMKVAVPRCSPGKPPVAKSSAMKSLLL